MSQPQKTSSRPSASHATEGRHGGSLPSWTFLSNHAHVLVCIARSPASRVRDIADAVGITERGVHKIISELEAAGIVAKTREGRRNRYSVNRDARLRHPLESHTTVGELLSATSPG